MDGSAPEIKTEPMQIETVSEQPPSSSTTAPATATTTIAEEKPAKVKRPRTEKQIAAFEKCKAARKAKIEEKRSSSSSSENKVSTTQAVKPMQQKRTEAKQQARRIVEAMNVATKEMLGYQDPPKPKEEFVSDTSFMTEKSVQMSSSESEGDSFEDDEEGETGEQEDDEQNLPTDHYDDIYGKMLGKYVKRESRKLAKKIVRRSAKKKVSIAASPLHPAQASAAKDHTASATPTLEKQDTSLPSKKDFLKRSFSFFPAPTDALKKVRNSYLSAGEQFVWL